VLHTQGFIFCGMVQACDTPPWLQLSSAEYTVLAGARSLTLCAFSTLAATCSRPDQYHQRDFHPPVVSLPRVSSLCHSLATSQAGFSQDPPRGRWYTFCRALLPTLLGVPFQVLQLPSVLPPFSLSPSLVIVCHQGLSCILILSLTFCPPEHFLLIGMCLFDYLLSSCPLPGGRDLTLFILSLWSLHSRIGDRRHTLHLYCGVEALGLLPAPRVAQRAGRGCLHRAWSPAAPGLKSAQASLLCLLDFSHKGFPQPNTAESVVRTVGSYSQLETHCEFGGAGMVFCACNPSYLGGRHWKDHHSRPAPVKKLAKPHLNQ
jgi:hypothetical protein